ncbi:MAG: hypothetical protein IAF38_14240, partial [Bacteroidia bacterium]|nr:hypothetical protein [Bacteroidia bacterium]
AGNPANALIQKPSEAELKSISVALSAAILSADMMKIVNLLMPFHISTRGGDNSLAKKLMSDYQANTGNKEGLIDQIKNNLKGDDVNFALYLLQSPPAAAITGQSESTLLNPGTPKSNVVAGGNVTRYFLMKYRTLGKKGEVDVENAFGYEYKGGLSQESRWLQFIWRQVVAINSKGEETPVPGSVTSNSGSYELTTDENKINYNLDNLPGAEGPWYESVNVKEGGGGSNQREAGLAAIYDLPHWKQTMNAVLKAFRMPDTVSVESRAFFNTYLIRGFEPIDHKKIRIAYKGTKEKNYRPEDKENELEEDAVLIGPYQRKLEGEGVNHLEEGMKKALNDKYPGEYDYIK